MRPHPYVRPALWAITMLCAGALAVGITFLVISNYAIVSSIREDQVANTQRGKDTNRAAEAAERGTERIEDCTTPGRDCFERSQQQTAEAVASINRVSILAAACADKPRRQTVEEIQSCVISGLAKQGR